jgi:esterase/lipase superfamily enzyme
MPAVLAAQPEALQPHPVNGYRLGTCSVSIPRKRHTVGEIERPVMWKLEFSEDPDKHIVLLDVEQRRYEEFYAMLSKRVGGAATKDMLVFVHGYDVKFEDAVLRTAQIAYDLEFAGAPVLYSWPSQGELRKYVVDETNAAWTTPHFLAFLHDLRTKSGAQRIHIIAHSMGNRPVVESLRTLALRPEPGAQLRYVLLMAPDIDADTFRQVAADIRHSAELVTLYASSNDRALLASQAVHGYLRAGTAGDAILVLPGIETIDMSAADTSFLGHSYYGHRSVLNDVFYLVLHDLRARSRAGLRPMNAPAGTFYFFKP